jgi:hypothetical protein
MPYLIVRGTPPSKGYSRLRQLLQRGNIPALIGFSAGWLYRVSTDTDEDLENIRMVLTPSEGYEIIAINAPYDEEPPEEPSRQIKLRNLGRAFAVLMRSTNIRSRERHREAEREFLKNCGIPRPTMQEWQDFAEGLSEKGSDYV